MHRALGERDIRSSIFFICYSNIQNEKYIDGFYIRIIDLVLQFCSRRDNSLCFPTIYKVYLKKRARKRHPLTFILFYFLPETDGSVTCNNGGYGAYDRAVIL